jgi:glycosyltransferase involved in cell wall biosynthesis
MADAALAAASAGDEVYFITPDPVKPFFSGRGREKMLSLVKINDANLHLVSCPVDYNYEFGTPGFRSKTYIDLVKGNVPEGTPIIVSDDASVWDAAGYLADKYPMAGVIHGNDTIYFTNAARLAGQLGACICVSGRIKNNLLSNCPAVDEAKVSVIPCGIPMPEFKPGFKSGNALRLLFIGRIEDKVKRATDLVLIGEALHKRGIPFQLQIVGNGKESGEAFMKLFGEAGIGDFVEMRGWMARNEIQLLLNESDVLLLTSNSEGMPLVMMEALASGCGFAGTRVSGIEDFEFHPLAADCLSVFTLGDIGDAVDKIMKVAAVPEKIRQQSARKLAEAEFSMEVCLAKYGEVLKKIKPAAVPYRGVKISAGDMLQSKIRAVARYLKVRLKG